jgi:hypothetical protein
MQGRISYKKRKRLFRRTPWTLWRRTGYAKINDPRTRLWLDLPSVPGLPAERGPDDGVTDYFRDSHGWSARIRGEI